MPGPVAPAWGDAGVIIPWLLYSEYGDVRILENSFDAMCRWIDYVHRHNRDLVWRTRTGRHYGDWLQVDAVTSRDVLATAYFAHSTGLVARAAEVLGRPDDTRRYAELRDRIASAFTQNFVDSDGRVKSETQTAYLLALAFDLLPERQRADAAKHLVSNISARGHRLTTGFVGVALLCPTLCAIGRPDLAYELLHQEAYPSWNYSILHGATTIWERWDGWTAETGFQSAAMNSFNHYSLGSIGNWLYGWVAGIRQANGSSGWTRAVIEPTPGGRLRSASASQETPKGRIATSWRIADGIFDLNVEIPPGCEAVVQIPTKDPESVRQDGQPVSATDRTMQTKVSIDICSGHYHFTSEL
jgi:alpha-L-rhamnosidase